MQRLPILLVFILLMGLLSPPAYGTGFEEARHLLARIGFGGDWKKIQHLKGGFYCRQPSMQDLENDDLKFSVDFRSLYTTVARRWWGLKAKFLESGSYPEVDFI